MITSFSVKLLSIFIMQGYTLYLVLLTVGDIEEFLYPNHSEIFSQVYQEKSSTTEKNPSFH